VNFKTQLFKKQQHTKHEEKVPVLSFRRQTQFASLLHQVLISPHMMGGCVWSGPDGLLQERLAEVCVSRTGVCVQQAVSGRTEDH